MKKRIELPRALKQISAMLLLVLLLVTALAQRSIHGWESSVTHSIYGWPLPLKPLFFTITQLGSGWMVLAVGLVTALRLKHKQALLLVSGFLVCLGSVEIVKHLVARPRPYVQFTDITKRDIFTSGVFGFPSGHSAAIAFLAVFFSSLMPKKYHPWLGIIVLLVGVSRIYLGMHAPLDVLGGFCLGGLVGMLFFGRELLAKHGIKA